MWYRYLVPQVCESTGTGTGTLHVTKKRSVGTYDTSTYSVRYGRYNSLKVDESFPYNNYIGYMFFAGTMLHIEELYSSLIFSNSGFLQEPNLPRSTVPSLSPDEHHGVVTNLSRMTNKPELKNHMLQYSPFKISVYL